MKWILAVLAAGALAAGCSAGPVADRATGDRTTGDRAEAPPAQEAAAFGGIGLPPSAEVLGTGWDGGIDQQYRMVVRVPAADLAALLADSSFTVELTPPSTPVDAAVEGVDAPEGDTVVSGSDSHDPPGDPVRTVQRRVAVDRSDPETAVVHLWMFTT